MKNLSFLFFTITYEIYNLKMISAKKTSIIYWNYIKNTILFTKVSLKSSGLSISEKILNCREYSTLGFKGI